MGHIMYHLGNKPSSLSDAIHAKEKTYYYLSEMWLAGIVMSHRMDNDDANQAVCTGTRLVKLVG